MFGKKLPRTYFCKQFMLLGKVSWFKMSKNWKHNLATWSHCFGGQKFNFLGARFPLTWTRCCSTLTRSTGTRGRSFYFARSSRRSWPRSATTSWSTPWPTRASAWATTPSPSLKFWRIPTTSRSPPPSLKRTRPEGEAVTLFIVASLRPLLNLWQLFYY